MTACPESQICLSLSRDTHCMGPGDPRARPHSPLYAKVARSWLEVSMASVPYT